MNSEQLARDIYALCEWLEAVGNTGRYQSSIPGNLVYVLAPRYVDYRKDILFFSAGHGWRVRKNPHWKTVYQERFAAWYVPQEGGVK